MANLDVSPDKEEKPKGPLNIGPGIAGDPEDDVASAEADEFIDGFSWRTVIGALFIGFIMMPGAIYLSLVSGQGLGPAAEWVTIILFMEVARRSYQSLKKQEIYLLYYMGAALTSNVVPGIMLAGGVFSAFIWNQYLIGSPTAESLGINQVPTWVIPAEGSTALLNRTFFHTDWLPAIGLMLFFQVFGRMNSWGLGYVIFRLTSDIERLPFPLAPIAAEGATALAESSAQKEGWRWRIFSIGAMIGVGWGTMYVLLPTVTGLIFSEPIVILTNPFIDFTPNTQKILPAALSALGTDLGTLLIGFVLPFPVVVGTFVAAMGAHIIANPILQKTGVLTHWTQGIDVQQTQLVNYFDFWLSFGAIGTSIAVAVIGVGSVIRALQRRRAEAATSDDLASLSPPPGRGDIPIWISLLVWAIGAAAYVWMCHYLVPGFPLWILIFFAFAWTPLFSYINARLAGTAGTHISIPYVREASVAMSGYRGTDIWFAPIPLADYGGMAQHFRTVELTRTKFISIVKVEILMLPIMLICSFLFWSFIWRLAPIPSASYPYASKIWPISAQAQLLWFTANKDAESNILLQALNWNFVGFGVIFAFLVYGITALVGLPSLFFYGVVNGIHGQPFAAIPTFIGGMLGRYYFSKRYGVENWRAYAPVLVAGYYCGMGLIGMAAVALALLSKSVSRLPF